MKGLLSFVLLLLAGPFAPAQNPKSPVCQRWVAYVTPMPAPKGRIAKNDPLPPPPASADLNSDDPMQFAALPEEQKIAGIECLLAEAEDQRPASFGAATRLDVSQLFETPHANLAALYVISYLYTGHFHHGSAVALRGDGARTRENRYLYTTNPDAVQRAYTAYRAWFAKAKPMGLAAALKANLQPLDGTGLNWF